MQNLMSFSVFFFLLHISEMPSPAGFPLECLPDRFDTVIAHLISYMQFSTIYKNIIEKIFISNALYDDKLCFLFF